MANELDERGPVNDGGRDVRVIDKKIPVKISGGSKFYDVIWWFVPPVIGGIVWSVMKAKARSRLKQIEQKLQHDASQIDNYLEQRVQVLKNCAKLVDKAVDLDKSTFAALARIRSGAPVSDEQRNEAASELVAADRSVRIAVESYPDLAAHRELAEAMRQNSYLQREITAAREVYNDTVNLWNREIFSWPTKQIVAAKCGYTTRIPFAVDSETREAARGEFF